MADVVTRFRLETSQFDSKLRDTSKGLNVYVKEIQKAGDGLTDFSAESVEAARALGTTESGAAKTRDRLHDLVGAFNDAAKAYNSLTEEQQQTDFGKAMSESLVKLQERIRETKQELYGLADATRTQGQGGGGLFSGDKLNGMLQVFGGNLMTKGAEMLMGLASEIGDSVKQSVELARQAEGVRLAFSRLGRGDILDGLRAATHGTVTDIELMKAAVKFNDFNLPVEELGTMLAFAQQKAKDTGQSVDYMVDSIVTGLGRKSLQILDNLGLSAGGIKEKMAETGDMTKAVGAIIREQMESAGGYVETAAERATRADVELKNAMEELGRTLQPLSGSFNDIKIAALDLLNAAIRPLIDSLTEAGKMRKELENAQGTGGSGSTRVSRNLEFLKNTPEGMREEEARRTTANYQREVDKRRQMLREWESAQSAAANGAARQKAWEQLGVLGINQLRRQLNAWQVMLKEYQEGAKRIMQPVKAEVDVKQAGTADVPSPARATAVKTEAQANTERISALTQEYQALADAAKKSGDAQSAGIAARMSEIRGEIGILQERNKELERFAEEARTVQFPLGSLPQLTQQLRDLQRAQDGTLSGEEWQEYQRKIESTQYQLDALKGKWKQGLRATFTLDAADGSDVMAKLREIQGVTIDGKTLTVTADTADAYAKVNELLGGIDGTTVTFAVQPKMAEGASGFTAKTVGMLEQYRKADLSQAEFGTQEYGDIAANIIDIQTVKTLVEQAAKAGISSAQVDMEPFWERVFDSEDIPDSEWQTLVDSINEKMKELKPEMEPITIDFETGNLAKEGKTARDSWQEAANAVSAVGNALRGVEDPSAKILGIVGQAVANIALGFAQATAKTGAAGGIFGWIAAIATGVGTMISTINAIHSATGYAEGGIIKGNSYSGDNIPADSFVNAGELILNRAQQANVAGQLAAAEESASQGGVVRVSGEQLLIPIFSTLKRQGYSKGEYIKIG